MHRPIVALALAVSACSPARPDVACAPVVAVRDAAPVAGPAGLTNTLTVVGTGVAARAPDVVHVQIGVQGRHAGAAAALADGQARMTRIREALTGLGVAAGDVRTGNVGITPQPPGEPPAYVVDTQVGVVLRAPDRLDEVLAAVFAAGATAVHGVTHAMHDPRPLAAQARDLALADARARAEQIAAATGVALGPPLSVQETASSIANTTDAFALGFPALLPVPGQIQATETVTIAYRIP